MGLRLYTKQPAATREPRVTALARSCTPLATYATSASRLVAVVTWRCRTLARIGNRLDGVHYLLSICNLPLVSCALPLLLLALVLSPPE
jgi:hypothetical protein